MKSKKGDSLSLNVIIIASIGLIVLVVLIAIFGGRMGLFGESVKKSSSTFCLVPTQPTEERTCAKDRPADYTMVTPPSKGWTDCSDSCYSYIPPKA